MQHEEFAERVTERLEAVADAVEGRDRGLGHGAVSVRANEIRVAARMVRDAALTVTRAEDGASPESPAEDRSLAVRW